MAQRRMKWPIWNACVIVRKGLDSVPVVDSQLKTLIRLLAATADGDKNAFYDPDDKYHLSDLAKQYIAGLLHHAPEITAITNQWVNSYKRLVPGMRPPYMCRGPGGTDQP